MKQPEDPIAAQLNFLRQTYEDQFCDFDLERLTSRKVQLFVEYVRTFVNTHTEAFITLCTANNYIAAHHYLRMMADCGVRVYAATLFKGDKLEKYIDSFLEGKEPKSIKYKGKKLEPQYILELMKQEDMWNVIPIFQKEGNRSTHFSCYYQPGIEKEVTDEVKRAIIGYYNGLLCFVGCLLCRLNIFRKFSKLKTKSSVP